MIETIIIISMNAGRTNLNLFHAILIAVSVLFLFVMKEIVRRTRVVKYRQIMIFPE